MDKYLKIVVDGDAILLPLWFDLQHVKHFISWIRKRFFLTSWVLRSTKHDASFKLIEYCAKVMQAECANFVLCSHNFLTTVRSKVHMKFHGVSSDNSLEQRAIFL